MTGPPDARAVPLMQQGRPRREAPSQVDGAERPIPSSEGRSGRPGCRSDQIQVSSTGVSMIRRPAPLQRAGQLRLGTGAEAGGRRCLELEGEGAGDDGRPRAVT